MELGVSPLNVRSVSLASIGLSYALSQCCLVGGAP